MRFVHCLGVIGIAAVCTAAACSSAKPPVPGKACIINSDCDNPLSCTFGTCSEACRADGDCPGNGLCVVAAPMTETAAEAKSLRVCVDIKCSLNSMCADPLVCGKDLMCRQECVEDRDCAFSGFRCVVGGLYGEKVCARPDEIVNDMLKGDAGAPPDGGLDAEGDGAGGAGGPGGAGGDGGGAQVDAGGEAASDGGGLASLDAPTDVAGQPDAGSDAPPIVVPEAEPNNTVEAAETFVPGTSVRGEVAVNPTADLDYFQLTAPPGAAGGYFRGSVTNIGNGTLNIYVYSTSDNGTIGGQGSIMIGTSFSFYWSARAGVRYLLLARPYAANNGVPYSYTLNINYVPIDDPSEPNDTSETPRAIPLGQPVSAYLFAGYDLRTIPATDFQDWYLVDLAAGVATIRVANVPLNVNMRYRIYNADFVSVANGVGANAGAVVTGTYNVTAPGQYRILIDSTLPPGPGIDIAPTLPDSFTRAYALTVSQ